jgi:hypothetical protein
VDDTSQADECGAVVVIACVANLYTVRLDPPTRDGDYSRTAASKNEAFAMARELWTHFRCGLRDESDLLTGNRNASRTQPLENIRRL